MEKQIQNKTFEIPNCPLTEGLSFRHFNGESDYPDMVRIWNLLRQAGELEGSFTEEDLANEFRHLYNFDPATDLIIAEINGAMIAYGQTWWGEENDNKVYYHFLRVDPKIQSKDMEKAMLSWLETRLLEISRSVPGDPTGFYVHTFHKNNSRRFDLLTDAGYSPVRYYFSMARDLVDIPLAELPSGISVRPAFPGQYHEVWQRANEAFREHWGFVEGKEEDYECWKQGRWFQPLLWQIAWDGQEMVGQVQNFVDMVENENCNRLRGYTEGISVLKDWRGKGIAKALIIRSMQMMKALNLTEVALTVDSANATGALKLYESLGYRTYRVQLEMRKPIAS